MTTARRCSSWLAPGAGLIFLVLTPPLQVPDENRHFNRSYMIATGHLSATERSGLTGDMHAPVKGDGPFELRFRCI